jgi:hypothetical protein
MESVDLLGYAASIAVLATFCMNTMLPLRAVALSSNILFASYGFVEHLYPVLILHTILFPVNLMRLAQVRQLGGGIRANTDADISMDKLIPFMRLRKLSAGTTLFRKGDIADRLFYIRDGTLEIGELGISSRAGELIGEIGIFAPDRKRMATAVCRTDCEVYELSEAKAKQLYFQDPSFGFAVLRLIIRRLLEDLQRFSPAATRHTPPESA